MPHKPLLGKLRHYGIRGSVHKWIESFLSQRLQSVVVDGEHSESVPVESGVPQGTVMGPLLFLLYINDLPDCVTSHVRLFADDCLVYRPIHSFEDQVALQRDLEALTSWAEKWGMRFNPGKCVIMSTVGKKGPTPYFYTLCDTILARADESTYLGIVIQNTLRWSSHIAVITSKANRTLGFLRRNLRRSPQQLKILAYQSLLRSKLEYACAAWDPYLVKDKNTLESVQSRAARFVYNDYRRDSSVSNMITSLGWESLEHRRKLNRLSLFDKIVNGKVAINAEDYLVKGDARTRSVNSNKYRQIQTKTAVYKHSFFPRTIPDWNKTPDSELADADTSTARWD